MRYHCWICEKSVTSELPDDSVIRALLVCPECIEGKKILFSEDEDEDGIPILYSQGWNDCLQAYSAAGIDATGTIADHTRKIMQEALDKFLKKERERK